MSESREVGQHDVMTNLLIRSKKLIDEGIKYDNKLNYSKVYDNPKEYEVSYVDLLVNLEEVKTLYRKRITEKNKQYNFFLDDTEDPSVENPISVEDYEKYCGYLKNGKIFAYTLKNTWTKGKDFFFITKGCVLQVTTIYEDRVFVDVMYKNQIGLMKLEELKLILTDDE